MKFKNKILIGLSCFALCLCSLFGFASVHAYESENIFALCTHWDVIAYSEADDDEYEYYADYSFSNFDTSWYDFSYGVFTVNNEIVVDIITDFGEDSQAWITFDFIEDALPTNFYNTMIVFGDWSNEYIFSYWDDTRKAYSQSDGTFTNPIYLKKDTSIRSIFIKIKNVGDFSYFSMATNDSYYVGYNDGYDVGYNTGNKTGYEDGVVDGKQDGWLDGYYDGYYEGADDGYYDGYRDGKEELDDLQRQYDILAQRYYELSNSNNISLDGLFWAIGGTPFATLQSILNVDVLGFNLGGIISGLVTALVVIWLIKKVF